MNSYEIAVNELTKMNEEYGDVWKLPPYKDSLMFAKTEVGECFDALMRMNPAYFRNREFAQTINDFYDEACDVAMMAIKALMSIQYEYNFDFIGLDPAPTIQQAILILDRVIADDLLEMNFPAFPFTIENGVIMLIITIESIAGENYFANFIRAKMDKTRAKIIARKAESNA